MWTSTLALSLSSSIPVTAGDATVQRSGEKNRFEHKDARCPRGAVGEVGVLCFEVLELGFGLDNLGMQAHHDVALAQRPRLSDRTGTKTGWTRAASPPRSSIQANAGDGGNCH